MKKIDYRTFSKIYFRHAEKLMSFWNEDMQEQIASHNQGWAQPYSFKHYLMASVKRFYLAYKSIPSNVQSCCDIGGFWGIYPLVLKELGYEVTMTEALKYYSTSFDELFDYLRAEDITIYDIDPFEEKLNAKYDYISIMAVLEHIPFSLKFFMENIKESIENEGNLYIEVPNIAYYYKRKNLLLGKSPLPKIEVIYKSKVPFLGHHHEYTMNELISLVSLIDLEVVEKYYYNYSIDFNFKDIMANALAFLSFNLFPNTREVISISARRK